MEFNVISFGLQNLNEASDEASGLMIAKNTNCRGANCDNCRNCKPVTKSID